MDGLTAYSVYSNPSGFLDGSLEGGQQELGSFPSVSSFSSISSERHTCYASDEEACSEVEGGNFIVYETCFTAACQTAQHGTRMVVCSGAALPVHVAGYGIIIEDDNEEEEEEEDGLNAVGLDDTPWDGAIDLCVAHTPENLCNSRGTPRLSKSGDKCVCDLCEPGFVGPYCENENVNDDASESVDAVDYNLGLNVGIPVGSAAFLLLVVTVWACRSKSKDASPPNIAELIRVRTAQHDFDKMFEKLKKVGAISPDALHRKPREVAKQSVQMLEKLGSGSFGEVRIHFTNGY